MKLLANISGRLAAIETKTTKSGDKFLTGRFVNIKSYKQGDEWKQKENWFSFTCFDKKSVSYLSKAEIGDKILVSAEPEAREYEGVTYYNLIISNVVAVTKKEDAKRLTDTNYCYAVGKKCSEYEMKNNFTNGSVAVTTRVKNGSDYENGTFWLPISAAGKTAEKLVDKAKGEVLHLEGELTSDTYTNKDGKKVNKLSLFVGSVRGSFSYTKEASNENPNAPVEVPDTTPEFMSALNLEEAIPFAM